MVTHGDLAALQRETRAAVFLGVQAGDHLVYVAEVGSEQLAGLAAQSDIRRSLLHTAGGKALLAARPVAEREAYLRRQIADDPDAVDEFIADYEEIRRPRIATHLRLSGARFAMAATVLDRSGDAVASDARRCDLSSTTYSKNRLHPAPGNGDDLDSPTRLRRS